LPDTHRQGSARRLRDILIAVLYLIVALFLYRDALNFGFNSDAFVLFREATGSFRSALKWDYSYHYMPLTSVWIWFQHLFFGDHQQLYEIVNILQHGIMSFLVFLLARVLGLRDRDALLSGLLFTMAGSAYQVALWSVVGSNYFVSGLFYLSALMLFIRGGRNGTVSPAWSAAALYIPALLAHEQSLSLLPVCFAYSLLVFETDGLFGLQQLARFSAWWRSLRRVAPLFIPLGAFILMKAVMSEHASVAGLGQDPVFFILTLFRGLLRCFLLRGSADILLLPPDLLQSPMIALLLLVVLAILLMLVFIFLRPVESFLLVWCLGQILMMQMAIGVSIRHIYLPTVPAAVLVTLVLRRFVLMVLSRVGMGRGRRWLVDFLLLVLALAFFLVPGVNEVGHAVNLWAKADRQTKNLGLGLRRLFETQTGIRRLYMLNLRSRVPDSRFEVFLFQNGAIALAKGEAPAGLRGISILHTFSDNIAAASHWTNQQVLIRILKNPRSAILFFDPGKEKFIPLTLPIVETAFAGSRMADAPYMLWKKSFPGLNWKEGKFPTIEVLPGSVFEAELNHPPGDTAWFFIQYLADPARPATVFIGEDRQDGKLNLPAPAEKGWTQQIFRVTHLSDRPAHLRLMAAGRESVEISRCGFLPVREDFSAPTTPEMPWSINNTLKLLPDVEFRIPVPNCDPGPCTVSLIHRAEFEGKIMLESPTGFLGFLGSPVEGRSPRWLSESFSGSGWKSAWVSIKPDSLNRTRIFQMQFQQGDVVPVGEGITDLYWVPQQKDSSSQSSHFNPWLLGLGFSGVCLVFLLLLFRGFKRMKN